jgi:hypothetical protein
VETEHRVKDGVLITVIDGAVRQGQFDDEEYEEEEEIEQTVNANEPEPSDEQQPEGMEISEAEIPPVILPHYSDEDLESALQRLIKTGRLPIRQMWEPLVGYARKRSLYFLMTDNYDRAAKIDSAIAVLLAAIEKDKLGYEREQQVLIVKERISSATDQQKAIQSEFADRIAYVKQDESEKLRALQAQHNQERLAFEEQWKRDDAVHAFCKPSKFLLQLRRRQRYGAISHAFTAAKDIKSCGDKMQKEEERIGAERAEEAMRIAYTNLLERQERQIQCFMENGRRKLTALEAERDAKLAANEHLKNQLELKSISAKQLKHGKKPIVPVARAVSRGETRNQALGVVTIRTRKQYASYKQDPDRTRLEVHLANIGKIMRPMTRASQRVSKNGLVFA